MCFWPCCQGNQRFGYADVGLIDSARNDVWRIVSDEFDSDGRTGTHVKGLLAAYAGGVILYSTRTVAEHGEPVENTVYLYRYDLNGSLVWKTKWETAANWLNDPGISNPYYNGGAEIKQACVVGDIMYLCHGPNQYIWDNSPIQNNVYFGGLITQVTVAVVSAINLSDGSIVWATGFVGDDSALAVTAVAESGGTLYCFDGTLPAYGSIFGTGINIDYFELNSANGSYINHLSGQSPDKASDSTLMLARIDPGNKVYYRRGNWGRPNSTSPENEFVMASRDWGSYTISNTWSFSDFTQSPGAENLDKPNGFWFDGAGDLFFSNGGIGGGGNSGVDVAVARVADNATSVENAYYATTMGIATGNRYIPATHYGSEAVVGGLADNVLSNPETAANLWWPATDEFVKWPQANVFFDTYGPALSVMSSGGKTFIMTLPINKLVL